jgi:hypothetical protein
MGFKTVIVLLTSDLIAINSSLINDDKGSTQAVFLTEIIGLLKSNL